jgi:hypothetical protein
LEFSREQTYYALKKSRMGYDLSNKKNRPEGKNYYALLIYKLERELGIRTTSFIEVKMFCFRVLFEKS